MTHMYTAKPRNDEDVTGNYEHIYNVNITISVCSAYKSIV